MNLLEYGFESRISPETVETTFKALNYWLQKSAKGIAAIREVLLWSYSSRQPTHIHPATSKWGHQTSKTAKTPWKMHIHVSGVVQGRCYGFGERKTPLLILFPLGGHNSDCRGWSSIAASGGVLPMFAPLLASIEQSRIRSRRFPSARWASWSETIKSRTINQRGGQERIGPTRPWRN